MTENAGKKQIQDEGRYKASLGVLADYGDSDEEDDKGLDKNDKLSTETQEAAIANSLDVDTDAAIKEARRARAREWAEKRRVLMPSKS